MIKNTLSVIHEDEIIFNFDNRKISYVMVTNILPSKLAQTYPIPTHAKMDGPGPLFKISIKKFVKRHCKWRYWISLVWLYFNLCPTRWRCLFKITFAWNWWSRADWSFESKSNHFQRSCFRKFAQGTSLVVNNVCSNECSNFIESWKKHYFGSCPECQQNGKILNKTINIHQN